MRGSLTREKRIHYTGFKMLVPAALFLIPFLGMLESEEPRKKPVLIRVDPAADGSDREEIEWSALPDPEQARENVKIGDFYRKKDNYEAAAERYREAIRHNPEWVKPYEKLIRTLEKLHSFQEALEVCQLFTEINPTSGKVEHFQKWANKLNGKADTRESVQAGK